MVTISQKQYLQLKTKNKKGPTMSNSAKMKSIFWFRKDLRLSDNPGLYHAAQKNSILPIFIIDTTASLEIGQASQWWLAQSLEKLNETLDNKLNIYVGDPKKIILQLVAEHSISNVYFNNCYEPAQDEQDASIKKALEKENVSVESFCAQLLWKPSQVVKKDGTPYKVFTPFYRNGCLQATPPRSPLPTPKNMDLIEDTKNHTSIKNLFPEALKEWNTKLVKIWKVGEKAAQAQLKHFITQGLDGYKEGRNFPDHKNVSRLSPHLHFGEISPNQIWYAVQAPGVAASHTEIDCFLTELGWREFSNTLLHFFPTLPDKNFNAKFDAFPWEYHASMLTAWKEGKTGYPIVDAGMRELAQTGYMHNRVRMIVASFLVKNLLIDWRHGKDWFWNCLVDADLANNSASWQWVAGSGADAAPYFRIFNPVLQGEKFDKHGDYTRLYVPELSKLPDKYLYTPWLAPENILTQAGITLGKEYPKPIINLDASRKYALGAYKKI
jgi:deoxyribodipyrimidine photo-lyase